MFGELGQGKRDHGSQRKRYKDIFKALKAYEIEFLSWETEAQDMTRWHSVCHAGSQRFESRRTQSTEVKH